MKTYCNIGLSSLLFIIPTLYTLCKVSNDYWYYKIFMFILPIISYICNVNFNTIYTNLDYLNISCIGLSYIYFSKFMIVFYSIIILLLLEFIINTQFTYSTMITYITLVISAFPNFTLEQTIVVIICLVIAIYSFMKRNFYNQSYIIYNTLWHKCKYILLLFASKTFYYIKY